jgi:hypothetical protein
LLNSSRKVHLFVKIEPKGSYSPESSFKICLSTLHADESSSVAKWLSHRTVNSRWANQGKTVMDR